MTHLAAIHNELVFKLYEAQERYKDHTYCNKKIHYNFHIGDWLLQYNIHTNRLLRKLDYQSLDLFKILHKSI
jgi:hypothetical protein